uniref:Putative secreted protein n=1 Tax=Anopheles darlingi TaxID=43151 RepID=A0A2M4D9C0_ANODA
MRRLWFARSVEEVALQSHHGSAVLLLLLLLLSKGWTIRWTTVGVLDSTIVVVLLARVHVRIAATSIIPIPFTTGSRTGRMISTILDRFWR